MIEREFINQKTKEFYIKKMIEDNLKGAGISQIRLKKIPLGEKIIIHTSRPSLIVGSKGSNIKDLTRTLKKRFQLENPQIEIIEVRDVFLDANVVAERIASSLEKFGSARFKGIGHKIMENVLNSGALGIELIISGKIPGARAKSWRFYQGYLKKCGDVAVSGVRKAQKAALLKSGIIGIKVAIMPPNLELPDDIQLLEEPITVEEEIKVKVEPIVDADSGKIKPKKKKAARKSKTEKASKIESASGNESKSPAAEKIVSEEPLTETNEGLTKDEEKDGAKEE
ncbi:MAG TPA: 30S ribosomal protein S3 [Candidatus Nanoarchaeia archaeon]|nr:30S ribosomal protein S3 [Candidatus Nanoarchaeia archaeon]